MSVSVNKVILIGNLGKDPEVRTTPNGNKVVSFSLATTESYKDKDGNWQEQTDWHNIVIWRLLAEKGEKLKKGNQVYLEGKIRTRSYDDKDGNKKYITEINVDTLKILTSRNQNSEQQPGKAVESQNISEPETDFRTGDILDDISAPSNDLPF